MSSIVHMWPVSQLTWTCQQSAVWETATVPLVCHVKTGNAGLQRRAPVPEKGYGDWLEVTCADPYISSLVLRGGVLRLNELPHLPYFYPLSSSSLRLLKNPKSAVNFTNSERPFNFAQVNQKLPIWQTGLYVRLLIWCFWWKVWFILLNSGTLFWFFCLCLYT